MKRKCTYIFIALFLSLSNKALALNANELRMTEYRVQKFTDTIKNQLSIINLAQYNGQPVDTLIAHLPAGYSELKITGWRSLKLAEILYVIYPNNIEVAIHVRNFQYMNPHLVNTATPKQNWNISLFRKEAVAFTVIFDGTTCFNGCENKYK